MSESHQHSTTESNEKWKKLFSNKFRVTSGGRVMSPISTNLIILYTIYNERKTKPSQTAHWVDSIDGMGTTEAISMYMLHIRSCLIYFSFSHVPYVRKEMWKNEVFFSNFVICTWMIFAPFANYTHTRYNTESIQYRTRGTRHIQIIGDKTFR